MRKGTRTKLVFPAIVFNTLFLPTGIIHYFLVCFRNTTRKREGRTVHTEAATMLRALRLRVRSVIGLEMERSKAYSLTRDGRVRYQEQKRYYRGDIPRSREHGKPRRTCASSIALDNVRSRRISFLLIKIKSESHQHDRCYELSLSRKEWKDFLTGSSFCSLRSIYSARFPRRRIQTKRSLIRKRMNRLWKQLGLTCSWCTSSFCDC